VVFNTVGSRIDVSEAQARELAGLDRRTHQRGGADRGADEAASHVGGRGARRRQVEQLARLQQLRHAVRVGGPQVVGRGVAVLGVRFGGRDHRGGREQQRRCRRGQRSSRRIHFRDVRAGLQQPQLEHVVRRRQPAHVLSKLGNGLRVGLVPAVPVAVL